MQRTPPLSSGIGTLRASRLLHVFMSWLRSILTKKARASLHPDLLQTGLSRTNILLARSMYAARTVALLGVNI
jgi:hypothetical protein